LKNFNGVLVLLTMISLSKLGILFAQPFAGTDDLGRTLIQNNSAGNPKADKYIAMFYFLTHGDGTAEDYWDLSEIVPNHPEVLNDYDNKYWGTPVYYEGGPCPAYYWGKPIYGYYRADDYWVTLRSVQLLTDAGVDILVLDATNGSVYADRVNLLMNAMDAVRAQGKNPPKIVFYTNTNSGERMEEVYENFYMKGAKYYHPDCWFNLPNKWHPEGQPVIIGQVPEAVGFDCEESFTWRESQWPNEKYKTNSWPWIDFTRPQRVHYNYEGEKEIINVSVAQHPNPKAGMGGSAFYGNKDNWGRSYHNGAAGNPEKDIVYGYNIQEQWDFAIKENPKFIFVTGWNEWTAGRWTSKDGNPEHSWFCDQASPEYSRDIEPTLTANMKDNYYMQLVNNIRRYKGVEANPLPGENKTINSFADWNYIKPVYKDYTGDTQPRNWKGAETKPVVVYTNNTGRNDFDVIKVARDKDNVYFYAQTAAKITSNSGSNWMCLYLDIDRKFLSGWKGFDYRISCGNKLEKYSGGQWKDAGTVKYVAEENKMMITIPRNDINAFTNMLNFEFKWSDNMQDEKDPLDWYLNGDVSPGGRFNWIYSEK
jgi:hypothetical protein